MRITDVRVDVLRAPGFAERPHTTLETALVRIETDDGLIGVGDAASSPAVVAAVIGAPTHARTSRGLRELLIGRDPREVATLWEELYRSTHYPGRRGALVHALSAIDVALWDLLGKAAGLPVHTLLGGAFHDRVPAYASFVMPPTTSEVTALAERAVAEGFGAVKFGWFGADEGAAADLELVAAARAGAGDAELMLDVGMRWFDPGGGARRLPWDAKTAIARVRAWSDYGLRWVEEPLPPDDLDGYRTLTAAVDVAIAAGEQEATRFGLYDLMDRGGIDVVQPDVGRVGGITEARRVADAAHDRNKRFAPHVYSTALQAVASLHLCAASPATLRFEYPMASTPLLSELVHPRPVAAAGAVAVPSGPGLGIELDAELVDALRVPT